MSEFFETQRRRLEDICAEKGIRYTHTRELILEMCCIAENDITPNKILKMLTKQGIKINISTLYNSLLFFEQHGILISKPKTYNFKNGG